MKHKLLFLVLQMLVISVMASCNVTSTADDSSSTCGPAESPHQKGGYSNPTPPSGFLAALGWLEALEDNNRGGASSIEIDWMRLHATVNGSDIVIASEEFDRVTTDMTYYGLYNRRPWFEGDKIEAMPFTVSNGTMIIEPSMRPEMVFHWWTDRAIIPAGTSGVWFEARIRISGAAQLQGGIDWWKDLNAPYAGLDVNNTFAGASSWECKADEWLIVSVGHP